MNPEVIDLKSIYILLTASETYVSKAIKFATADSYTHVSISFNDNLHTFYSFARKNIDMPLPAGMIKEHLFAGYFGKYHSIPCSLYEISVSDMAYFQAKRLVESMYLSEGEYHYSIIGLLLCKLSIPLNRERHYFCSQFVGRILEKSGAVILPKPSSLMRPVDYMKLPQAQFVYEGTIGSLLGSMKGYEAEDYLSVQ